MKQFAPVVVTLAMLAYVGGFSGLKIATAGVDEYMARCRKAIEALPMKIGRWEARRLPLDAGARDLLQPNAEASLLYATEINYVKYEAQYSVIQAADSRYMTGHAPPNCYPGNGYDITRQTEKVWRVGEFDIKGIEYAVQRPRNGRMEMLNVRNFFIFPDGHFGATLAELDAAAADYHKLKYGVTQVQFLTGAGVTDKLRDEIFSNLVGSERSLEMIRTLRTGIPK